MTSIQILCPVCNGSAVFAYRHPESEIWRCKHCRHAFTRLDTLHEMESYSTDYYDDRHKDWFENPNTPLFNWINNHIPQGTDSLIDMGCGRGDFLRHIHAARPDIELYGADFSSNASTSEISYIQGDIMELSLEQKFDVVVSLAVIEHVEDPSRFIDRLRKLCAEEGKVVVMTVNESGALYRLARLAHWMGINILFDRLYSAHHLQHFSVKSLRKLLTEAGFKVEYAHYHNSPLAAVDLPARLAPVRKLVLALLAVIFTVSRFTPMCLLQTVVARPSNGLHKVQRKDFVQKDEH